MRRSRQAIRLQGLLKVLQEGGHPHVEQLAARFNVRRETIYREIRAFEGVGFPIVGDTCEAEILPTLNWNPPIDSVGILLRHPSSSDAIPQLPQPDYLSRIPLHNDTGGIKA